MAALPVAAPVAPPRLLALSTTQAWKTVGAGIAAIPVGILVTAVFGALIVGIILGPLLIIGGLIAIPVGFLQVLDPTRHSAIKQLGRTTPERRQQVAAVEQDLLRPENLHVRMSEGNVLTVTPHWIVVHGKDLAISHRNDLLWFYTKVTSRKRFGITVSKTFSLILRTRHVRKEEIPMSELEAPQMMWTLGQAAPHALSGWDVSLDRLSDQQLVAHVDARRAQLAQGR